MKLDNSTLLNLQMTYRSRCLAYFTAVEKTQSVQDQYNTCQPLMRRLESGIVELSSPEGDSPVEQRYLEDANRILRTHYGYDQTQDGLNSAVKKLQERRDKAQLSLDARWYSFKRYLYKICGGNTTQLVFDYLPGASEEANLDCMHALLQEHAAPRSPAVTRLQFFRDYLIEHLPSSDCDGVILPRRLEEEYRRTGGVIAYATTMA